MGEEEDPPVAGVEECPPGGIAPGSPPGGETLGPLPVDTGSVPRHRYSSSLEFEGIAGGVLSVQFNGDTGNNYQYQNLRANLSSVFALGGTSTGNSSSWGTSSSIPQKNNIYYYLKSGQNKPAIAELNSDENTVIKLAYWWNNSVDEITSMKIYASNTSAITGKIRTEASSVIRPHYIKSGIAGFTVFHGGKKRYFKSYDDAIEYAGETSEKEALETNQKKDAVDTEVTRSIDENTARPSATQGIIPEECNSRDGCKNCSSGRENCPFFAGEVLLETVVTAVAVGNPPWH